MFHGSILTKFSALTLGLTFTLCANASMVNGPRLIYKASGNKEVISSGDTQHVYLPNKFVNDPDSDFLVGWQHPGGAVTLKYQMGIGSLTTGGPHYSIKNDQCSNVLLTPGMTCWITLTRALSASTGLFTGSIILPYQVTDGVTLGPLDHVYAYLNGFVIKRPLAQDTNPPPAKNICAKNGSIVYPESQILVEKVPLVGSSFELYYSSMHTPQYVAAYNTVGRRNPFNPEGWTLSIHHFFDMNESRLFKGTGLSESRANRFPSNNEIQVVSSDGTEVYVFSTAGKHLRTLYGLLGSVKYTFNYSSSEKLTSVIDAYGNTLVLNRNAGGELQSVVVPSGQITTIALNGAGLISSITNPAGESHSFTYHAGTDLLATFHKPGGQTSTMTFDVNGRLTQDLGAGGNSWSLLLSTISGRRNVVESSALNTATTYRSWAQDGSLFQETATPYGMTIESGENSIVSYVNTPLAKRGVNYGDDERFGSAYPRTTFSYTVIDQKASTTSFSKSVVKPAIPANSFDYTSISSTTTTRGRVFSTVFDKATRRLTATSQEGAITKTDLDQFENIVSAQTGTDVPWTMEYNAEGKLSSVTQGPRKGLQFTYNTEGFLHRVTNLRNEVTAYNYDTSGRAIQQIRPDGEVVGYRYNSNGALIGVTPPTRPEHTFGLNLMELISSYTPPVISPEAPAQTRYEYNLDKQPTEVRRPDGQVIRYQYNNGLLSSVRLDRGIFSHTYVPNTALLSTVTSPDGLTSEYGYYGDIQKSYSLKRASDGFLYGSSSYTFDLDHRIASRTIRSNTGPNSMINYFLNSQNKVIAAGDLQLTYSYPSGRLWKTQIGNISDERTYDTSGDLQQYVVRFTNTNNVQTTLYGYTLYRDVAGRINAKIDFFPNEIISWNYSYDNLGRLIEAKKSGVVTGQYQYDKAGNRIGGMSGGTTIHAEYDAQDRMTGYNSKKYLYNRNGDLAQIQSSAGASTTLRYDALGNLMSFNKPNGDKVSYRYDGQGRVAEISNNGNVLSRLLYNENSIVVAEILPNDEVKQYVHAENAHSPDYMIHGSNKYRIVKDHLGSVRLVVNVVTGQIAQRMDYSEFGLVTNDTNPGFQLFGFAGGIYQKDTGLLRFGARDYDPETGRWTAKDPILFAGGDTNLYGYVMNDPVNFVDPKGLWSVSLNLFGGYGGGLTIGQNPNGSWFGTARVGVGYGAGFSYDPKGTSPDGGTCHGIATGAYAEASGNFGPFEAGLSSNSGYSQYSGPYANPFVPNASYTPSIGVGIGASGGLEISFH